MNKIELTKDGVAAACITIGGKATKTEKHAANELAAYINQMSGASIPIVPAGASIPPGLPNAILIGRPETNTAVRTLVENNNFRTLFSEPDSDGFVIKTVGNNLLLSGFRDRGTLYSVYHLLEIYFECGFFWDGEHIPVVKTLTLPPTDVCECPRFSVRYSLSGSSCAANYSFALFWGFDEWKKELDWLAKNKANTVFFNNLGTEIVEKRVDARMGLQSRPITAHDRQRKEVARQVFDYARKLDFDCLTPFPLTYVSREFVETHPEGRYVDTEWVGAPGKKTPNIYPTDRIYQRLVREYIDEWTETYGTWHKYCNGPGGQYSEQNFDLPNEKVKELQVDYASGVTKAIKEADPLGEWYYDAWGMTYELSGVWSLEGTARQFCEHLSQEDSCMIELWPERDPDYVGPPIYKDQRIDYFGGKRFILTFLNEFGGDDYLHGNFERAISAVKELATDEKAKNCIGVGLTMEVLYYDIHYYDLLLKLAWNPFNVNPEQYVADLAVRRYGRELLREVEGPFRIFVKTVYSAPATSEARYQHRLYPPDTGKDPRGRYLSSQCSESVVQGLVQFLEGMLALAPEVLEQNKLLQYDIFNAARQYLTELFNTRLLAMEDAFRRSNREELKGYLDELLFLLEQVETVLSSRCEYQYNLEETVSSLAGNPGNPPLPDLRKYIRMNLTFATLYPAILDYPSKDIYELVRFYYRPRVEAFVRFMRGLAPGATIDITALESSYDRIESKWDQDGYEPESAPLYAGPIWQAVKESIENAQSGSIKAT